MKKHFLILIVLVLSACSPSITQQQPQQPQIVSGSDPEIVSTKTVPDVPGEKWKNWFIDADQDSFGLNNHIPGGDSIPPKFKKKQPIGYVADSTDCDDSNAAIHPGAVEVLNYVDDNCDGQIDEGLASLVIVKTDVLMPEFMGGGGANDNFQNNDANDPVWISKIKAGNFKYWFHTEGHNSTFAHWAYPYGTKGNGYNTAKPDYITNDQWCKLQNGEFCGPPSPRDFNLQWLDFMTNTDAGGLYTANISNGSYAELQYVLNRLPQLKLVMLGQEIPSDKYDNPNCNYLNYAARYYSWRDSIKKHNPGRTIYAVADMPDLFGPKTPVWITNFQKYRSIPNDLSIRWYLHGFFRYTLNGDISHDSIEYDNDISTYLPAYMEKTRSVWGDSISVMVSQESVGVPGYATQPPANGNSVIVQGNCLTVMHYFRVEQLLIHWNRDRKIKVLGRSIAGVKNLMPSLDFKWLAVINRMYQIQRYSTFNNHSYGSQVDIEVGYLNGVYSVILQNRTGNLIPLPEFVSVDGKTIKPVYTFGDGYACDSKKSTTGTSFNPVLTGNIPGNAIAYLEFH